MNFLGFLIGKVYTQVNTHSLGIRGHRNPDVAGPCVSTPDCLLGRGRLTKAIHPDAPRPPRDLVCCTLWAPALTTCLG